MPIPKFIATSAVEGATSIVKEAERLHREALGELGADAAVAFPNTAYYLPLVYGYLGLKVEKMSDLALPLERARELLPLVPEEKKILDAGLSALFAAEIIQAIRLARNGGHLPGGPIDDVQMRSWGVQMADGRMPGIAIIIGCARSNEAAVELVRQLQSRGILALFAGGVGGRSTAGQLLEEGVRLSYDAFTALLGPNSTSAIYGLDLAARVAFGFGGVTPGDYRQLVNYCKSRCPAFVLTLGELDAVKIAIAMGAANFGFPLIADTSIPEIPLDGMGGVFCLPFDQIPGENDGERARGLVRRSAELAGIKVKITEIPIPVAYGSAFEGELVRRADLRIEFGGKGGTCFEWLRMESPDELEDGRIRLVGPNIDAFPEGANVPLALIVQVAGARMRKDFESVLERQIHHFINYAQGVQHQGQRDITWIRIGKDGAARGFEFTHLGHILHASFHKQFGAIVDKVEVTLYIDYDEVVKLREGARRAYRERDLRLASLTDEAVDTFYSCTLCQSFAPNHVCVITPERGGLCGAYNWHDCQTAFEIEPTGPNQPVPKGNAVDRERGEWEGVNQFVYQHSHQNFERFTLYSLMDAPPTSCGCFECIMAIIPEANGVMVVSREDYGSTPFGMTFSTLAGMVGGGVQTPGMMGHSKFYLLSKKFIPAEGGIRRVVWLSRNLKEEMEEELREACARDGVPDLLDKIADGTIAPTLEELLPFLEQRGHPALNMEPLM